MYYREATVYIVCILYIIMKLYCNVLCYGEAGLPIVYYRGAVVFIAYCREATV